LRKTDIEIALGQELEPITDIAEKAGLEPNEIYLYGDHIAKINLSAREGREATARTVLVTAMTPTRAGEGKTTCAIGLNDGLNRIGKRSIVTLREPSLGPVFGLKGGAAGGGYSQVLPMVDINLHFTGDIHAVTAAHNLLTALLDNEYSRPRGAFLLPKNIIWNRVIDMNDRALRNIVLGLGKAAGQVREGMFEITAASEIMAILGLSRDLDNLKARLGNIIIAKSSNGDPVRARDIDAQGAMTILLRNALKPNLVQTIEGNPAIVHTGPFANIAHGTNSIIATDMARRLADIVVVEAGFGSDLGAEKFLNLVSRRPGMVPPDVVVIVATIRALRHHGGALAKDLNDPNVKAVIEGMDNLQKHIENMKSFNRPVVVALNRFESDSQEEVDKVVEIVRNGARAEEEPWSSRRRSGTLPWKSTATSSTSMTLTSPSRARSRRSSHGSTAESVRTSSGRPNATWIRYGIGDIRTSRCAWQRPSLHCPTTRVSGTDRLTSRWRSETSRCVAAPASRSSTPPTS